MTKESGERLRTSFIVSSVFSLTLFFFGPTHIYFTNILEYSSSFSRIFPLFVGLSVLCALLLTSLGFLKNPLFEKAIALLFCFSFLLWLRATFSFGIMGLWTEDKSTGTQAQPMA